MKGFENDEELSKFLQLVDEFSDIHIDQENLNMEESKQLKLKDKVVDQNIVQLPSNYIPWGLVPLDELFDHNDIPFKPAKRELDPAIQEQNIGSQSHPKLINLSTGLTARQKSKFCSLIKEFADVFAWEYRDLKTYDTNIIQHRIPLEKYTIPFK